MKYLAHSITKNENGSKIRFLGASEETKRELGKNFNLPFLSQELLKWYSDLPKSKNIMFDWTYDFYVIGMENLLVSLEGYRFIREDNHWKDLSKEKEWNENWIVISRWNDNPVIADISKAETPIFYDYNGGKFSPILLVNSLEKYDYFLSVWLDKHDDRYYKDGDYHPDLFEVMKNEWRIKLNDEEITNICEFLGIVKSEEDFEPVVQRIDREWKKYYVYLENPGENKLKVIVIVALKKEMGLSLDEIRNKVNTEFLIAEGYGENTLALADYFISLGAKVRVEQK